MQDKQGTASRQHGDTAVTSSEVVNQDSRPANAPRISTPPAESAWRWHMAYSTEGWGTTRDGQTVHCEPFAILWAVDHPPATNPHPWSAYAATN